MEQVFKSLTDRKEIDLIPYIKNYLETHTNTKIYVGCDSQNAKYSTSYAVVIVLHHNGKGGHVLYSHNTVPRNRYKQSLETGVEFARLWVEVEKAIEVAEYLRTNGIQKPSFIDIDLNPDPRFKSNQALRAALGYVESMGYVARCKPDAVSATYVADKICK
jgi:predicted RNase H-related nuclease YkuK (DUF458 family)